MEEEERNAGGGKEHLLRAGRSATMQAEAERQPENKISGMRREQIPSERMKDATKKWIQGDDEREIKGKERGEEGMFVYD